MDFLERLFVTGVKLLRHREPLFVRKRFAVIHDANAEACGVGGFRHRHRDVPAAKQVHDGLRQNRLDKNLQGAAADQAVVIARLVVEIENHLARCFVLHHFFRRRPHFRFHAAAANRSGNRAVLAHQHSRAFIARDRAIGVHDGGEGPAPPGPPHLDDFFKQVHVLPQPSAYGALALLSTYSAIWTSLGHDVTLPIAFHGEVPL